MLRLDPATTVLLVVDVQERLIPALDVEACARMVRGVDVLLEAARLLSVATLATEQYPKGLGPTISSVQTSLSALGVAPTAKTIFSAAEVPDVSRVLARLAPRAIVVVGVEAHVCVFQTVRDLQARGFEVHVPHDAVASRKEADRLTALNLMARLGAYVTSSETVAFDWLREAQGDAFKAMSKKIR